MQWDLGVQAFEETPVVTAQIEPRPAQANALARSAIHAVVLGAVLATAIEVRLHQASSASTSRFAVVAARKHDPPMTNRRRQREEFERDVNVGLSTTRLAGSVPRFMVPGQEDDSDTGDYIF